jgi:putative ABC transport system permease protein
MRTLWQDIRFAARMLVRSPGFTLVVVVILALGIGANTAIFSVVNAVLLRPLPFREPQRLVEISTRFDDPEFARMLERAAQAMGITNGGNSTFDFREMRQRNHVFENVIAVAGPWLNVDVSGDEPRNVLGACVSGEFFSCLGIPILLGRTFLPEEDQPGRDQVVILGHHYWTQRFGADPDIIGKTISFKEGTYTVVGVLRPDFRFLEYGGISDTLAFFAEQGGLQDIQVWKPLALTPAQAGPNSLFSFGNFVLARLKPGITVDQAQAELDVISRQLTQEFKQRGQRSLRVSPIQERLAAHVRPALWALSGTVAFVLLIACANVANMLLARSIGRQREVVIRAALGAGRLRLVRQFLTESLLLSLLGGMAALLLTFWSLASLKASLLLKMPRLSDIRVDGTVLCFTLGVSMLTGLLIGLAPILRLSGPALGRALKEGSLALRSVAHRGVLSRILLVSEVALSLILLIGAGLMVKSFWRLTHVDLGFDPKNVLVVDKRFDAPLLDRIRQLPGVETAAAGSSCISVGGSYNEFRIVGRDMAAGGKTPEAKCVPVTEDYFATLRIPLRAGRVFTANDHAKAERVVIVNEMIARRYLSDASPLDQILTCKGKSCRIVGVVADVRPFGLRSEVMPMIYIPFSQADWVSGSSEFIIRTGASAEAMLTPIRREFLAASPLTPAPRMRTFGQLLAGPVAPLRLNTQLLSLFGALALILACVGVYGLMAFFVSQRTQEIGIRMALGARSTDVLKSVVGQGLRLALMGTGLGLAGAFGLTRVMASLLYDVSPTDPLTFVCVSLILVAIAVLASYLPARRAARIDPMVALRYE